MGVRVGALDAVGVQGSGGEGVRLEYTTVLQHWNQLIGEWTAAAAREITMVWYDRIHKELASQYTVMHIDAWNEYHSLCTN